MKLARSLSVFVLGLLAVGALAGFTWFLGNQSVAPNRQAAGATEALPVTAAVGPTPTIPMVIPPGAMQPGEPTPVQLSLGYEGLPTEIIRVGIFSGAYGISEQWERGLGFRVNNYWSGIVNGEGIGVMAGAGVRDTSSGALIVSRRDGSREGYMAPSAHGALWVRAENSARLTIESDDGTIFYFDVPGRQFVADLAVVVPTVDLRTPRVIPTVTPVPGPSQGYPGPGSTAAPSETPPPGPTSQPATPNPAVTGVPTSLPSAP